MACQPHEVVHETLGDHGHPKHRKHPKWLYRGNTMINQDGRLAAFSNCVPARIQLDWVWRLTKVMMRATASICFDLGEFRKEELHNYTYIYIYIFL